MGNMSNIFCYYLHLTGQLLLLELVKTRGEYLVLWTTEMKPLSKNVLLNSLRKYDLSHTAGVSLFIPKFKNELIYLLLVAITIMILSSPEI